jgi:prephenate dehydrogenase
MPLQRLSILGVGLLGGSIGLALKSASNACKIVGYGHRPQTLETALRMGAIDEIATDATEAVRQADLVILASPVGTFWQLFDKIKSSLANGAIVTDVGSTKRSVCRLAEQMLPAGVHFVGSHPMAGSEKRGVDAANADLFHGALCITTPTSKTDSAALREVESFWQKLGMRVTRLSPEDHDRLLAEASHLPHLLAAALIAVQSDPAFAVAGKGFFDTTRIAAGDGGLWRDIFLDNADNLRIALTKLRQELDRFESLLKPEQSEQLRAYLDKAAQRRKSHEEKRP